MLNQDLQPKEKATTLLNLPFTLEQTNEERSGLVSTINEAMSESLRLGLVAVSGLYTCLTIGYLVFLHNQAGYFLAIAAGITAVITGVSFYISGRRPIPGHLAHPLGALIILLGFVNAVIHQYLMTEPLTLFNIVLVILSLGLFFFSVRWFGGLLMATLVAWSVIESLHPSPPNPNIYVSLLFATTISVLIYTVRMRIFERYEQLRVQEDQRQAELEYRTGQLETSLAVGRRINSILDLDTLLNEVVHLIQERYGCYHVGIFLTDGDSVQLRAVAGILKTHSDLKDFRLKIGQEGLVGWVAGNGRLIHLSDVSTDERYLVAIDALASTRSELDLPLRFNEHTLGVLNLQSRRPSAFTEADVAYLQLLADQVAIAIHNASIYQSERSARHLAEMLHKTGQALSSTLKWNEVLNLILDHVAEIVSYDRAGVLVQQGLELVFQASRGFPKDFQPDQTRISIDNDHEEDVYKEIYRTQRPLNVADVLNRPDWFQVKGLPLARSWLGVPLTRSGVVVGMLSLTRETYNPYTDHEVIMANAFSGQAAIALENARLYDRLAKFNQQLEYEVRNRTIAIQEAYEQLEKLNQTKSDFISITSHELRTPLTIVHGYSQMLLKDDKIAKNEHHQLLVSGILGGAVRLGEIVNSMLDMLKIDNSALELYPEPISIPSVIEAVVAKFQTNLADRSLTLTIEPMNIPAIEADLEALQKVFYQIVINAIKYTPNGGQIRISGDLLKDTEKDLNLPREGIEIIVSDTGIGIDPSYHELIFTKFYQTGKVALHSSSKTNFKGGGPGLGLAIARGVVEAHRGRIWVESPGHDEKTLPGSKFHIALPLRQR